MEVITNKIIDIHNHSLPMVDDGAKSKDECLNNIKALINLGLKDIVLTSHYIVNSKYQVAVLERKNTLKELKKELKDLDVNLYLGNEVFIEEAKTLIDLLNEGKITTINNSKYLLIEAPRGQLLNHLEEVVMELNEVGITPILAHPERYVTFQREPDKLKKILEYECLVQVNMGSIIGQYGTKAKRLVKQLLKEDLVDVLASDLHHTKDVSNLDKALKKLKKKLGEEKFLKLSYLNPKHIIENEQL